MLQQPSTHQTICCSSWRTARLRFWCGRCLMSSLGKQANQQRERMRAPGGGIGASRTARTAGTHCYRSVLLSLSFSRCCCCCRRPALPLLPPDRNTPPRTSSCFARRPAGRGHRPASWKDPSTGPPAPGRISGHAGPRRSSSERRHRAEWPARKSCFGSRKRDRACCPRRLLLLLLLPQGSRCGARWTQGCPRCPFSLLLLLLLLLLRWHGGFHGNSRSFRETHGNP
mmetsp:Transcript_13206/g.29356  ORF Transcript_13206/g.29356 Transcript_13206/m.29356 type:complete len:227 (+) Transcript_13206:1148-1828(+)